MSSENTLNLNVISFGFRHGLPPEADIVMDVRFLQNPHWDEKLQPKTGLNKDVGDYIEKDPAFETFMDQFKALLEPLIPRYARQNKNDLTIAIGCTGGQHRSVYCTEIIGQWLKAKDYATHIAHRDIKS